MGIEAGLLAVDFSAAGAAVCGMTILGFSGYAGAIAGVPCFISAGVAPPPVDGKSQRGAKPSGQPVAPAPYLTVATFAPVGTSFSVASWLSCSARIYAATAQRSSGVSCEE